MTFVKLIETAPKDGTELVLYGWIAGETEYPQFDESEPREWVIGFCAGGDDWVVKQFGYSQAFIKPTHWLCEMPGPVEPSVD